MGMDAGYIPPALDTTKGAGMFDEYGKYMKLSLTGALNANKSLGTTLGYTHDDYEEDGTDDFLAHKGHLIVGPDFNIEEHEQKKNI